MAAPTVKGTATPTVPPTPPKPPLGLPTGSVRALLAITLSGTLWYMILRRLEPPDILVESALLVVAFYFGVRSTAPVTLSSKPAPAPADVPRLRQPLFLPRGVVRSILAVGFLGVIAYVFFRDGTIDSALVLILQVIVSYVVGYVFSYVLLRRARAGKELGRAARAARNVISLAAIGITAGASWTIATGQFSDVFPPYLQNGLAWAIAFYFGSRVSAG